MEKRDRYQGGLLGLAVGDAVGVTLEFTEPGSFTPIHDMAGGGPFQLDAGEWTDDTSMALCLAESLIQCRGFNPIDQLERYLKWYGEGYFSSKGACFDIGTTVLEALNVFDHTGNAYCGSSNPMKAGNGSIMRLAPIPMYYATDSEKSIHYSALSSKTTHAALEAMDACRYLGALIVGALQGAAKEELLSDSYCPIEGYWTKKPLEEEIARIANGSYKHKNPPAIRGTGYVVQSLEAALWAFYHSRDFRHGLLLAVNLGEDADTTGAVYGQLAGAYYGINGIPDEWLEKIVEHDIIRGM
ncbi:MAG: ADP-ribosylglycohydrolase, partial [Paenibacillus sp.]|nr:ADP-ribosylglycohydrolase [Paenibacillus sp.]